MPTVPRAPTSAMLTAPRAPISERGLAVRNEQQQQASNRRASSGQGMVDRIRQHAEVARVLQIADMFVLNDKLAEELQRYKVTARDLTRLGHFTYGVDIKLMNPQRDVRSLIEASLKIQAYRDRVTEIQVELFGNKNKLLSAYQSGSDVINLVYNEYLRQRGGLEQQRAFVAMILDSIQDKIRQIDFQLKQIDATLDNLDKAHFTYKHVGELAEKILSRVEGANMALRTPMRQA